MYPDRELARLAVCKDELRGRIALHRTQCAQAAARVMKPLVWLDQVVALWRKYSPIAKMATVPLGVLLPAIIFSILKRQRAGNKAARAGV